MGNLRIGLAALIVVVSGAARAAPAVSSTDGRSPATVTAQASAPADDKALTPDQRAAAVAAKIPFAKRALREVHREAAELKDAPLRAAVEAQLLTPWLPADAYVYAHPAEAEAKLRAAKLLADGAPFAIPAAGTGSLAAAPGGPCATGHHGYPGGLAVHEWTNLQHARALAQVYKNVYGVNLNDEWLVAAALWHDTLKAGTLPWDASGDCPHQEAQLAGTALHHPLGIAAAILRHLPEQLILVIASSHAPPTRDHAAELCNWLRAAGIIAVGDEHRLTCPSFADGAKRSPIEAFVNHFADADFPLSVSTWSWYSAQTPGGWERFAALEQDGSDLAAFQRAGEPR